MLGRTYMAKRKAEPYQLISSILWNALDIVGMA